MKITTNRKHAFPRQWARTDEEYLQKIASRSRRIPETGCIEWQAHVGQNGYGQMTYQGAPNYVHRIVYAATHGIKLRREDVICHRCDNPKCCNIDHLFLGDHAANVRDMFQKGRDAASRGTSNIPVGEKAHLAKITDAQEREIRAMLRGGFSPTTIHRFGVYPISRSGISKIKHGQSRKNTRHAL
jgi:hypothetical protein